MLIVFSGGPMNGDHSEIFDHPDTEEITCRFWEGGKLIGDGLYRRTDCFREGRLIFEFVGIQETGE